MSDPSRTVNGDVELRAFVPIDRMQPQYAAYWGLTGHGAMPLAGMSQLLVEIAPGNPVLGLMDDVLKACEVRSAGHLVERSFGLLEVHAHSPDAVTQAGEVILRRLGRTLTDRRAPELASSQILTNVEDHQSQLLNRIRRGDWTLPHQAVFIAEITPAAYVNAVGNELEKATPVDLVRMAGAGVYGRMIVTGSESDVELAAEVTDTVLARIAKQARPTIAAEVA